MTSSPPSSGRRHASPGRSASARRATGGDSVTTHTRAATPAERAMTLALLLLVVLRELVPRVTGLRSWGVDMARDIPSAASLLPSAVLLILALPAVQRWLAERWTRLPASGWRNMLITVLVVLSVAAVLFPMETYFHGDGGAFMAEVYKLGADPAYESEILLNVKSSPLTGVLLVAFTRSVPPLMQGLGLTPPETTLYPFAVLSALTLLVLVIAMRAPRGWRARAELAFLVLGSAGVLFVFTYVEFYGFVFGLMLLTLASGCAHLTTGVSRWPAVVVAVVAIEAHYMAVTLLPAVAYLLLHDRGWWRERLAHTRTIPVVLAATAAVAALAYALGGFADGDSRVVMPLFDRSAPAGVHTYTLLSAAHLTDLLNVILLLAPVPALWLAGCAVFRCRLHLTSASRFVLLALGMFALFLFFANTSYGLPRDWDIAAPLGVLLALFVWTLDVPHADPESPRTGTSLMPTLGVASLVAVLPWLLVNLDADAGARRFARVLELDAGRIYSDYSLSGFESLRKYYVHVQDGEGVLAVDRRMVQLPGYAQQYRQLLHSARTVHAGDPGRQAEQFRWILDRLAGDADRLLRQGVLEDYHISLKEIDSLSAMLVSNAVGRIRLEQLEPDLEHFTRVTGLPTASALVRGINAFDGERFADAATALRSVVDAGVITPRIAGMLGASYVVTGRPDEAETLFVLGERMFGDEAEMLFLRAAAWLREGVRHEHAAELLRRALRANPPEGGRSQIEETLRTVEALLARGTR